MFNVSGLLSWIEPATRVVKKMVAAVNSLVNGPPLAETYKGLVELLQTREAPPPHTSHPDFVGAVAQRAIDSRFERIESLVMQSQREAAAAQQILALQSEVTRLTLSASGIDRHVSLLSIQVFALETDLMTIRNVEGLVADVAAYRFGIKRLVAHVNHLSNVLSASAEQQIPKLAGIDVDRRPGAVSQRAAVSALEQHRAAILRQLQVTAGACRSHREELSGLISKARSTPSVGDAVVRYLEASVSPSLDTLIARTQDLELGLQELPVIAEQAEHANRKRNSA